MNKLFKDGDYVLLEDCEAFDEKYGLFVGFTMWNVARKMGGAEHENDFTELPANNKCVGIRGVILGIWHLDNGPISKLTVEDVLYRSENGLTLDELREIHGAFEDGKQYECVVGAIGVFTKGNIYKANGDGMAHNYGHSDVGNTAKFKSVTTKPKWVPSVGDEVMTSTGKYRIELPVDLDGMTVVSYKGSWAIQDISGCKPIDKERECIIQSVVDLAENLDDSYTSRDLAENLYNAGMLKEGDKQ